MKRDFPIAHQYVEFIPAKRDERTLYISLEYETAVHNCFCGCGSKVVTPLNPTGWRLLTYGDKVSLRPSVGSWGLPCRSHYVIDRDICKWAGNMSQAEIDRGRMRDELIREEYFGASREPRNVIEHQPEAAKSAGFWAWLRSLFR